MKKTTFFNQYKYYETYKTEASAKKVADELHKKHPTWKFHFGTHTYNDKLRHDLYIYRKTD